MTGPRRSTATAEPFAGLNYAAIGATASDEVLSFPPAGFACTQVHHRIGSGARRFDIAGRSLMTWGVLRNAGIAVEDVEAEPADRASYGEEPQFLEDGTPWITPGMTATLVLAPGAKPVLGPVKVVSIVDEPGRIGFTYGSRDGHPVQVEQLLLLEHTDDDAVWLTVRTISRPVTRRWRWTARFRRLDQRSFDRRIVTALHPANAS